MQHNASVKTRCGFSRRPRLNIDRSTSNDYISHMKQTSISELKAHLSAFLDIVRQGDDVMITDRGRLIARLTPMLPDDQEESRRDLLMRTGRLRSPSARLPKDFLTRTLAADPGGLSLSALLDERGEGW